MRVSVIIPVYNRAKFVEKAVQSALMQSETGEVLFIDDGSTDDSLAIGHQLAAKDSRVRVFQQPNGKNYGPGAARNIGLRNAKFEYIAFLDSDDFFVENRFAKAKEIFEGNTEIEGISEAVQLFNYTNFEKNEGQLGDIIMFNERISSNDFFELFTTARKGYSSIVGLIIKKTLLQKTGLIDEKFRLAEDVDFIMRLGLNGKIVTGNLSTPVAIIRNHAERSVYNDDGIIFYRQTLYQKWFKRVFDNNWSKKVNWHILINYVHFHPWTVKSWESPIARWSKKGILLGKYLLKYPKLIFKIM